jgi:tRNA(Ile)-lysidine synthase
VTDDEFAAAMGPLGPFEPAPRLAAAVSGGADSLALAILANAWARARGGSVIGLVVDHGLRPEAAREADLTTQTLTVCGVAARVLRLEGLAHGPALAERARAARYAALIDACAAAGTLHLLLGHHAADQAETVALRVLRGSAAAGLAGMASLVELASVRLLRPLLGMSPGALREVLRDRGINWAEDPSNQDANAQRVRLRLLSGDRDGPGTASVAAAAAVAGAARAAAEARAAAVLGCGAMLRPEGFGVISGRAMPPTALGALLQAIGGAPYPPAPDAVASLAARPAPCTLGGVRLLPAGRLGPGLLLVREASAMAKPVAATQGAMWDGRYRLSDGATAPAGATIGALAADTPRFRASSTLPDAVLRTLPAVRLGTAVFAVPHLRYPQVGPGAAMRVIFAPPRPAAGAPFRAGSKIGPLPQTRQGAVSLTPTQRKGSKGSPLAGIQGAEPLGGVRGGAPAALIAGRGCGLPTRTLC